MLDQTITKNFLLQKRTLKLNSLNIKKDWGNSIEIDSLGDNDIDIWYTNSRSLTSIVPELKNLLSNEEKIRIDNFRSRIDQVRRTISRGGLRIILSKYIDKQPSEIEFDMQQYGKPSLHNSDNNQMVLHFNTSHSYDVIMYVVTKIGSIGVDVERIQEFPELDNFVNRFFSTQERNAFTNLRTSQKKSAFFSYWARKESYIKARGNGLSLSLDQFDVSILPDQSTCLLKTRWDESDSTNWLLSDIKFDPFYAAALTVNIPVINDIVRINTIAN